MLLLSHKNADHLSGFPAQYANAIAFLSKYTILQTFCRNYHSHNINHAQYATDELRAMSGADQRSSDITSNYLNINIPDVLVLKRNNLTFYLLTISPKCKLLYYSNGPTSQ